MDRDLLIQNHFHGTFTLRSYLQEGIFTSWGEALVYPIHAAHVFYHTKDANQYLLKNNLRIRSPLDMYAYFKKRDGTYRFFNCVWSCTLLQAAESCMTNLKRYDLHQVFDYKDSYLPEPSTGQLPKISVKKAMKYMFICFGFDILTTAVCIPIETLWTKMVTDYEPVPQYDHIVDCLTKTVEKEGFLGLFKVFGYSVLIWFIQSAFDAYFYYNNEPNRNSDLTLAAGFDKSWRHLFLGLLTDVIISPINRCLFCKIIEGEPNLKLGGGLFDGFWIGSIALCSDVLAKVVMQLRKEGL